MPNEVTPVVIEPAPESRLDMLLAQYDLAHAEKAKAEETLKAITDGIKHELATAAPSNPDVRVDSPHLARPLRMTAVTSFRIDTARLKKEQPETYVRYGKESTAWVLKQVTL